MSSPSDTAEHLPDGLQIARALDLSNLKRTVGLYLFLLVYEFSSLFMLASLLSTRFGYTHISYAPERFNTYFWVCILTPLAVLPAGTRLQTPAQFMFPVLAALIMMTTPLFLVAELGPSEFWSIYACLMMTMAILAGASRWEIKGLLQPLSELNYKRALWLLIAFFAALLVVGAKQNFHFVSFFDIYKERNSADYASDFIVRVTCMYVFSLGGLLAGVAILRRRYWLAALALMGFVFWYGVSQFKSAILGPPWLLYMYLSVRYFVGKSTIRFYVILTLPFFVGVALKLLFPDVNGFGDNFMVFAYFAFVSFRFYATSNEAVGIYQDFFSTHPHTYWSHITGINWFVHYPYADQQISQVLDDQYNLGNFNASFLATDTIAAYGYQVMPLVSLAMAAVYVFLNSAGRNIRGSVLAMMMVMPALMFNERAFMTSLLTGAIIFFFFYLAWMPESWRDPQ